VDGVTGTDPMTSATAQLWRRRDRRIPAVAAASAMTGLPPAVLREAARISLAASVEAEALLATMGERVRSLPLELADTLERCVNSVRGPVVWSETITARANALGNDDVFVCTTARRTFDCPANRMLVAVLTEIAASTRALRGPVGTFLSPDDAARIEQVAARARLWRHHDRLDGVPARAPRVREQARMRHGRHAEALKPVFDARRRVMQPFEEPDIEGLCDPMTATLHIGVLEVFDEAVRRLGIDPVITFADGALRTGPLAFRHPRSAGSAPPGLSIAGEPVRDDQDLWRMLEAGELVSAARAHPR